jgi:hypothetical protein
MAKRRTISYRTTALMSLIGGAIALAAAVLQAVADVAALEWGAAWSVIGGIAIIAWFIAAASGVLALSTEYKRWAIAGLVMCGAAIIVFLVAPLLAS